MKHVKIFEQFVNEDSNILKKALPGVKFVEQEIDFEPEDGYSSVASFSTKVRGLDEDLYLNIYDGKSFCFFYDSSPISTSVHSKSDADKMSRTQIEAPLPLNKLTKDLFDEVVNKLKDLNEALNEELLNSLKDLKAHSPEAHSGLIDFWAELSRGSNSSAQHNLSTGMGKRFRILVNGDKMEFEDTHAGLKYEWNGKRWI